MASGARSTPNASATARTAAITSLLDEPMPRPTGMAPVSLNSPPHNGSWQCVAHSAIAYVAARSALVRSAGNTVTSSAPGRRTNSARVPRAGIGRVTRPARRRPRSSRKTPWRISPW